MPSGLTLTPKGQVPTPIVVKTLLSAELITHSFLAYRIVTYNLVPSGLKQIPSGLPSRGIVELTELVVVLIILIELPW